MDGSPPGSSVHGIFQARVLEWIAISFSRGSSPPRNRTRVSHIADRRFTVWAYWIFIVESLEHTIKEKMVDRVPILHNDNNQLMAVFLSSEFSSLQFSCSLMSDSLRPHGPQHARPPCPSPTPGIYPNSCPLSQWCHPIILSSDIPLASCLHSFPASGSFQMSQLFTSGSQSIGVSASTLIFPVNTGLISFSMEWLYLLAVQGTLKSLI